jgi:predicted N-acetyltransferase YhbS
MNHPYLVREAKADDDQAIGELLVEAFVSSYAHKLPEVRVTERRKAELRDVASKRAVAKVWVVEVEGLVVGTVALWPPGANGSEAWVEGAADVRHLAVSVGHRGGVREGKGASAVLLDQAEKWAKSQGWPGVCLHVRRGAVGVKALYQRRGYQPRPEGDLDLLPEVFLEAMYLPF